MASDDDVLYLVAKHSSQGPAEYNPNRWQQTLSGRVDPLLVEEALRNEEISKPTRKTYWSVDRPSIARVASATDFTSEHQTQLPRLRVVREPYV